MVNSEFLQDVFGKPDVGNEFMLNTDGTDEHRYPSASNSNSAAGTPTWSVVNSNCRLRRPVSICVHLLPSVRICVEEQAIVKRWWRIPWRLGVSVSLLLVFDLAVLYFIPCIFTAGTPDSKPAENY